MVRYLGHCHKTSARRRELSRSNLGAKDNDPVLPVTGTIEKYGSLYLTCRFLTINTKVLFSISDLVVHISFGPSSVTT